MKILLLHIFIVSSSLAICCQEAYAGYNYQNIQVENGNHTDENFANIEKRLAIVCVNSYRNSLSHLPKSDNDAFDMDSELKNAGFDVVLIKDKNYNQAMQMFNNAAQFYKTNHYNVALLYFSGHGSQFGNIEMFEPNGISIPTFQDNQVSERLSFYLDNFIAIPNIIDLFNMPQTNAIMGVVDACRTDDYIQSQQLKRPIYLYDPRLNEFEKKVEANGRATILYATTPLESAGANTVCRNSEFTCVFLSNLKNHPCDFEPFVKKVESEMLTSGSQQIATANGIFSYQFCFYKSQQGSSKDPLNYQIQEFLIKKNYEQNEIDISVKLKNVSRHNLNFVQINLTCLNSNEVIGGDLDNFGQPIPSRVGVITLNLHVKISNYSYSTDEQKKDIFQTNRIIYKFEVSSLDENTEGGESPTYTRDLVN